MKYYAGLDIGGTKCAACIAAVNDGKVTVTGRVETPFQRDYKAVLDYLLLEIQAMATKQNAIITSVGISAGGPLDGASGKLLAPPNLFGWENLEICDYVTKKLLVPSYLQNDADACALAEWRFGAGKGTHNMCFLTFGTGFGAGLILNGRLYTGCCNMAGEIGHIRLYEDGPIGYNKAGSFEGFCSGGGIKQQIASVFDQSFDMKQLCLMAREGEQTACALIAEIGANLGRACALLTDLLNPEKIVIGGIYMRAEDLLRPYLLATLTEEALAPSANAVTVVPAALGESIGDYGAITAAMGDY